MADSMRKQKISIAVACLLVAVCTSCGMESAQAEKAVYPNGELLVGSDNYPPYNYTDSDGNPTGIDVEMAKEALGRLGYEAKFVLINWERKKELVENGTVDCIWGSFTMDGREEDYRWAGPYMASRQVVAVNPDSDIYTLADLKGQDIAVQTTTQPEQIFLAYKDSRIPEIGSLLSLQNRELIYPLLSKGYVDAIAAHETAIRQYMSDYDITYRILEEPLRVVGLGVAFAREDTRGIDKALSEVFAAMQKDGTTERILSHYLEDPAKYLEVTDED